MKTVTGSALALTALAAWGLAGCRASLQGGASTPPGGHESGVVYYLTRPVFTIDVKDRVSDKEAEPVYDLKTATAADPTRRFAVQLRRGTLSKDVFDLKLRADGTLDTLGATSETRVPELIKALGSVAVSALGFPAGAAAGLAALRSSGPPPLDDLFRRELCAQRITAQEFSDTRCVASSLVADDGGPRCKAASIPCPGATAISVRDAAQSAKDLDTAQLQQTWNLASRLTIGEEAGLWTALSQATPENAFAGLFTTVTDSERRLLHLRRLDSALAGRLGESPRHEAATLPDPKTTNASQIVRNLGRVLNGQVDVVLKDQQRLATATVAKTAADAALAVAVEAERAVATADEATRQVAAARTLAAQQALSGAATELKQSADTVEGDTQILAGFAADATVIDPGLVDRVFDERIAGFEKQIRKSFTDGKLATAAGAKSEEPGLMGIYRTVSAMRAVRAAIGNPPTPLQRIAKLLVAKKQRSEQAFARYVADPTAKPDLDLALADYRDAVARFLELDSRLQASQLAARRTRLEPFVVATLPTKPTGNDSKAYRDYREELDRVVDAIAARLDAALVAKKPEPLPRGTQVTRTLDQVVSCVVGQRSQLEANEQALLLLAEIWIKYGGKDAVVFRTRNGDRTWLDCGVDPFAASLASAPPAGVVTSASKSGHRPGMRVRKLSRADLANPVLDGVVVQIPALYDVVSVLVDPAGKRVLKGTSLSLPADDEFLEVGFKGGTFRSQELTVALHPNGALAQYKLTSTERVSDTAQQVADASKSFNDALDALAEANKPSAPVDPLIAENEQLQRQLLNAMLRANLDAIARGEDPPFEIP